MLRSSQVSLVVTLLVGFGAHAQNFFVTEEGTLGNDPAVLSPPQIVGASNCVGSHVWNVSVRGGHPTNGEYDLYFGSPLNGVGLTLVATARVATAGATVIAVNLQTSAPPLTFPLDNYVFIAKERRQIPQFFPPGTMITVTSKESNTLQLRDPNLLPKPFIAPAPLFACGAATAIGGHQPSDVLRLMNTNGTKRFEVGAAFGTYDFVGEIGPAFSAGEKLYAEYSTCSGAQTSPQSATQTVVPYPKARLPKVTMSNRSTVAGVSAIPIGGLENGARLTVDFVRAGQPVVRESRVCVGGEACTISAPSAWKTFELRDEVISRQSLCPDSDSDALRWTISSCYSQSPLLAVTPKAGDTDLVFGEYALGSWLVAHLCLAWDTQLGRCTSWDQIGSAFDSSAIGLKAPLKSGDRIVVSQQVSDNCPPLHGAGYVVR